MFLTYGILLHVSGPLVLLSVREYKCKYVLLSRSSRNSFRSIHVMWNHLVEMVSGTRFEEKKHNVMLKVDVLSPLSSFWSLSKHDLKFEVDISGCVCFASKIASCIFLWHNLQGAIVRCARSQVRQRGGGHSFRSARGRPRVEAARLRLCLGRVSWQILNEFCQLRFRPGLRTRMNKWMKSHSNFERLVLGCIDSYDSNQVLILQHFSRSTRFAFLCTAKMTEIQYFGTRSFTIFYHFSSKLKIWKNFPTKIC